jgi:hypothetical protein
MDTIKLGDQYLWWKGRTSIKVNIHYEGTQRHHKIDIYIGQWDGGL